MRIKTLLYFFIFLTFCSMCVTPYDPPVNYSAPLLVVNGMITDQPGPYTVSLEFTNINSKYSNYRTYPEKAKVWIVDSEGTEEQLLYNGKGIFQTNGMTSVVGRSYYVRILLADGRSYESEPELLKKSPPISNFVSTFVATPNELSSSGHFKTFVETNDSISTGDYYRWTWINYQFRSFDSLSCGGGTFGSCGGFKYCQPCWFISRCEACITLQTDRFQNGQKISQLVLNVPYNSRLAYYLEVSQYLISENAYHFWQDVNDQVNVTGGVFDPPPARISGNLHAITNQEEQVLGFFSAAGLSKKLVYVKRDNVPLAPLNVEVFVNFADVCMKCKENYFFTRKRPENWDDSLDKDCLNCPG